MIPEIGVMVGAYIFTRMLSFMMREDAHRESTAVKVFALLTMIVTVFVVLDLLLGGTNVTPSTPRF